MCGDAPIVLVTAYHDMETTIRAMKLGAFDYIHKPFADPAALDLVINRALQRPAAQPARGERGPGHRRRPGWATSSARPR